MDIIKFFMIIWLLIFVTGICIIVMVYGYVTMRYQTLSDAERCGGLMCFTAGLITTVICLILLFALPILHIGGA